MNFMNISGHFMYFLAKNFFSKWTPPNPMGSGRGWQKMKFCIHIKTFHALSIEIIFNEIATNPLTHGDRVAKHFKIIRSKSQVNNTKSTGPNQ